MLSFKEIFQYNLFTIEKVNCFVSLCSLLQIPSKVLCEGLITFTIKITKTFVCLNFTWIEMCVGNSVMVNSSILKITFLETV